MRFKHAFHVFVDNFSTTYKLLVFKLLIAALTVGLSCAVIIPTLNNILSTAQFEKLSETFNQLWADLIALNMEKLHEELQAVSEAFSSFKTLLADKSGLVAVFIICMTLVLFINRFLTGVGNYVTGTLTNDKMTLHATSSFTRTLIRNLGKACLFAIIWAPITFAYDVLCAVIIWAIVFVGLQFMTMPLIKIFLVAVLFITLSTIKLTFTCDWLPAVIQGKLSHRKALAYCFDRRGKHTGEVLSTSLVIQLIIITLNVVAVLFTFGAGILITVPAGFLLSASFMYVNYFDTNGLKYFVDEYTIIGPQKESPVSREEFFKGEE